MSATSVWTWCISWYERVSDNSLSKGTTRDLFYGQLFSDGDEGRAFRRHREHVDSPASFCPRSAFNIEVSDVHRRQAPAKAST